MDESRFTHKGTSQAKVGEVLVGGAFGFINEGVLVRAGLAWVGAVAGRQLSTKPQIVSLLGPDKVTIFGEELAPVNLSVLNLSCVTSDKALYQSERDAVKLFVLQPHMCGQECSLVVNLNGSQFSKHTLRLGKHGDGQLVLRDLAVGNYEIFFEGGRDHNSCTFQVAQYKLAPLVASLVQSHLVESDKLQLVLSIESFGSPVSGALKIDLIDGQRRIASETVEALNGTARTSFLLQGSGPHSLSLQLLADPAKTASVPILGSRASERSRTVFSPLGTEVVGALIGEPDSREVRGIYLGQGGSRSTPLTLEKVDDKIARLRANVKLDALRVVAIDPTHPKRRANAVDPANTSHPSLRDERYARAEKLFKDGQIADSRAIFEDALTSTRSALHPYYAYWLACCCARLGDRDQALEYLRRAIEDGWVELSHMANDDDLACLRGYPPFDVLCAGGTRELFMEFVDSGQVLEVHGFAPVTILAIGAIVEKNPWEGWAALLAPSQLAPKIDLPEQCLPGQKLSFEVQTEAKDASIYCIVKDARLISTDTPGTRLAAHIKDYVDSASKQLKVGRPDLDLKTVNDIHRVGRASGGWGAPLGATAAMAPTSSLGGLPPTLAESIRRNMQSTGDGPMLFGAAPMAAGMMPMPAHPAPSQIEADNFDLGTWSAQGGPPAASNHAAAHLAISEPEILFAGLLTVDNGRAKVQLDLPDLFADYIVECFAISGMDWAMTEARFRAEKYPLIHLNLPLFAHKDDKIVGNLYVAQKASGTKMRIKLLRNGEEVPLTCKGAKVEIGKECSDAEQTFEFSATAGAYQAIVESVQGEVLAFSKKTVQEPGKLKLRKRALQLLRSGESINLTDDHTIDRISILPGVESTLEILVDATAEYGHACCEQTAAIILSACVMYIFAAEDPERRKKAESIIVAGIRREQSMWLPGRGFKVYPEADNTPHAYLGEMAARHLWNLSLLGTGSGGRGESDLPPDLADAQKLGLEMAADVMKAHNRQWPPQNINSYRDAWEVLRFSNNGAAEKAISFIQQSLAKSEPAAANAVQEDTRYLGANVSLRMNDAYAAASLLRAGGVQNITTAIGIANTVVKDLNQLGRLYSTCDSVAAIALMTEMQLANITKGSGTVEINNTRFAFADAMALTEPIQSIKVIEGCITVAVDRVVEEDWNKFAAGMQIKTCLLKGGNPERNFKLGDSIELQVSLEDGYKDGDLLWVCLPDALSRIVGGGQVKLFSADFRGKTELRIPLAATGTTGNAESGGGEQRIAVCVRNMFQEERAASPEPLSFKI